MVSEERYLWLFQYRLHMTNRIWWAYFLNREEVEAFRDRLRQQWPCMEECELMEHKRGLIVVKEYFHYQASCQIKADAMRADKPHKRQRWLFPLAPFACDLSTSFVKGLGKFTPCEQCNLSLPVTSRLLIS